MPDRTLPKLDATIHNARWASIGCRHVGGAPTSSVGKAEGSTDALPGLSLKLWIDNFGRITAAESVSPGGESEEVGRA